MLKQNLAKAGSSEASRSLPSLVGIKLVAGWKEQPFQASRCGVRQTVTGVCSQLSYELTG